MISIVDCLFSIKVVIQLEVLLLSHVACPLGIFFMLLKNSWHSPKTLEHDVRWKTHIGCLEPIKGKTQEKWFNYILNYFSHISNHIVFIDYKKPHLKMVLKNERIYKHANFYTDYFLPIKTV